jgi:hypothetical protein
MYGKSCAMHMRADGEPSELTSSSLALSLQLGQRAGLFSQGGRALLGQGVRVALRFLLSRSQSC